MAADARPRYRRVPDGRGRAGDSLGAVGAPQRSRSAQRSRGRRAGRHLTAALVVALTTLLASTGILWLAAHLFVHLTGRGEDEPPLADVVELLKVALVVGLSKVSQAGAP
jgi:hypothetical protein